MRFSPPPRPFFAPPFPLARASSGDGNAVTLPARGYRQARTYSCGFASALMVVRYLGIEIGAEDLYRRLGTDRSGTRQASLVRVLRELAVRVNLRYDLDFDRMARSLDGDKLIVGYLADAEHWLVVYGYGRAPRRIFVADPRPGQPCEHAWESYGPRLGSFGMICSRRQ